MSQNTYDYYLGRHILVVIFDFRVWAFGLSRAKYTMLSYRRETALQGAL